MKKRFILNLCCAAIASIFVVVYAGEAYAALSDRCPRQQVKTELKAKRAKTRYMRGSIQGINGYLNNHDPANGTVLAFVQWGGPDVLKVDSFFDFSMKPIGNDRYCVMLDRVKVNFYAAPMLVMPSDFRRSSCEYKLIRKHEQRHLDALYEFHDKNTSKYAAYLGRIARETPLSVPVENKEQAQAVKNYIEQYFSDKFYHQVHKSIMQVAKIQQKIDSPQEYIGVGKKLARCEQQRQYKEKQNKRAFAPR